MAAALQDSTRLESSQQIIRMLAAFPAVALSAGFIIANRKRTEPAG
jgi:hypothetical protein